MKIPNSLKLLANKIQNLDGTAYLVGGWVRDSLLSLENKDFDIEVHGVEVEVLKEMLSWYYKVDTVGESYKIWKVTVQELDGSKYTVDVSLPRTEKKVGEGHKAFEVTGDPFLGTKEASRRRDFTINSMLYDILTGEIVDHWNGQEDLKNGIIRAVDPETFVEDSLRVLRAVQFGARFNFKIAQETVDLCQHIKLNDLPSERIWGEIEKWLLSRKPSVGLRYFFLLRVSRLFKFNRVKTDAQTVTETVKKALDCVPLLEPKNLGKRLATQLCILSEIFDIEDFLNVCKVHTLYDYNVRKKVLEIVNNPKLPLTDTEIRRESTKKDLNLFLTYQAALLGASSHADFYSVMDLISRASELQCYNNPLIPLLMGQDVLDLGLSPGKRVGEICKSIYEMQIEGKVNTKEEAIEAAKTIIKENDGK